MGINEIANVADNLEAKSTELSSLLLALNEAIFRGGFAVSEYEDAMGLLVRMTFDLANDARELSEGLFAFIRTDQKGRAS